MDTLNLPKYIGEKIRTYRLRSKLTQEELANKLDTKKATISNYETGYRTPQQNMLFQIAKVLNISINDLFPPTVVNNEQLNIQNIYEKLEVPRQKVVLQTAIDQLQEQNKKQNEDRKFPLFKAVKDLKDEPKKEVEINMMAAAGHGTLNFDKENPIETILLPENNIPLNYDYACKVSGNSMEPMYHDGEIIFLKSVHEIRNNMIAVVEINEDCFLKKLSLDKDKLQLISLNNEVDKNGVRLYPDFYADEKDNIFIIGEVVK